MNPLGEQKKSPFFTQAREWTKTILIALAIALPIRFFIAEPFIVSGASMDPTFASGQFLIVDRLSYRLEEPKRGDVVIFRYPNDPKIYFIKRIVGLPGESIRINEGKVDIVNSEHPEGITLDESYIAAAHASKDDFVKQLGTTEYFVMGDNRLQSSDSRAWGPLDRHYIIGRPVARLLPVTELSLFPGEHN
ncbi:MAG: signal peptidase I [Candidatus Paceibacterota bacterium]|jgi:signal peptidase I